MPSNALVEAISTYTPDRLAGFGFLLYWMCEPTEDAEGGSKPAFQVVSLFVFICKCRWTWELGHLDFGLAF